MIDHGDHETLHVIKGGFFLFAVVRASKAPWLPSITRRATGGVPPCTVLARCAQPGPEDACFLLAISPTYQVRRRITTRLPMITCDFLLISKRKVKLVFLLCSCFTEPRWSTSVHTWNGEALPCQREPLTKVSIFTRCSDGTGSSLYISIIERYFTSVSTTGQSLDQPPTCLTTYLHVCNRIGPGRAVANSYPC